MTVCKILLHNHLPESLLTYTHRCFLSISTCMNVKTSKVLIFRFVKVNEPQYKRCGVTPKFPKTQK